MRQEGLSPSKGIAQQSNTFLKSTSGDNLMTLPAESEAMKMIELYFRTMGCLNPCLDKNIFVDKYQRLLLNEMRSTTRSWLALLNAIFAISTNVMASTSPTQEVAEMAEKYFRRAVSLVMPDLILKSTLQNAQLLVLLVSYLQGTQHSSQAWSFHGLAVKTALELGLHNGDSAKNISIEKEMRKRVWYWIVIHDRTLASTLNEAVASLYGGNASKDTTIETQGVISGLLIATCRLLDWKLTLPENLQIVTAAEIPTIKDEPLELQRCHVLLTVRYLGVRILVLRPILRDFLDYAMDEVNDVPKLSLLRTHGINYLRDCVDTCTELVATVDAILDTFRSGTEIMGAWWFSVYYTFNASLVMLGVLLVYKNLAFENFFTTDSINDMRASLDRAVAILHELDKGNPMIKRCIMHLLHLIREYSKISQHLLHSSADLNANNVYMHYGLGT
ncbi:hypothetical protein DL98DRAFT_626652 [Cadophora sp. DSE1049]|nr:hypothetical protein DL98DRAFT_626652 [Cadophora sp. DSE1049]